MTLSRDDKLVIGGAAAAFAVAAVILVATRSKPAAAATPSTSPAPVWKEVTEAGTLATGTVIALSDKDPDANATHQILSLATVAAASVITDVHITPEGLPPPAGFPDDGGGTSSIRLTGRFLQPTPYNPGAGMRLWIHT